ncbi:MULTISPECIES: FtsX-like permease family protein [Streptococcus]|uniref:Bacitracin export permease protein BceB n=2 Tax=Streptococcus TaxID=1301 RepID=A0A3R9JFL5_STRMT|nr:MULTISPECIES: FtsX-like permease family protein [Streptococcus]RSI76739.1 Bacitracin export permease protein BceB [Streptococcus mitis]RXX23582.1 ABC transporter permease [Streptococcus oralis]
MYPKLILRNVFRNLQTYTIYFFSLTLIYSLLYAFNALPSHPVMQSLSGAKEMLTTVMSQYMGLLSYLILSAIAFLIVYSTNFVLGRRKKELGLYATLGMKKKQIIRTLFFETMLVNIFALILGFLLGLVLLVVLAKVASEFFMANYFGNLVFFDIKSIILLVYSYLVTSFIVGVMDILTFRKQNIIALIQENGVKKSVLAKGKPVLQALLFILSTAVIGFGALYFSDYHHLSLLKSWGILLVSVFVIFVILFYNTLSHFILISLRKLPQTYYNKLNTFKIRQFSKQADSNSVTLAVLSLTLTLALSLLVFSGSAYTTMNRELNKYSPYDVSVNLYRGQDFQFAQDSVKDRLKADGFDFNLIKEEYSYPIYSSDLTYKDLIDTSNLWAHDKELPESKVPIIGISAYNHLRKLQGKKAVDLADNQFLVNANYKGTAKQIQDFLLTTKTLMINGYSLNLASSKPLETVYFLSSVGTNDTGTLIVPDTVVVGLTEDHTTYVANFKKNIDKRKVETFLSQWIEKYYFTRDGAELNPFTYQTKGRIFEIYLGFMGVIVFVMIFVSVIFIIISLSILSLQTSTSALDSVNDYQILYLLGNKRKQNRSILLQQILSYFLVPLVIAGPLAFALSTALLGYFENFANTSISIDITYLGVAVLLFVLYLLVTYRVSWQIIEN